MARARETEVAVEQLRDPLYDKILCYPSPTDNEVSSRLAELRTLGIEKLAFRGPVMIGGLAILGKGCVGLVVEATTQEQRRVALKIRRTDANRENFDHEASMLNRANSVGVGPRFLGSSKNFLVMEFVRGKRLFEWLDNMNQRSVEALRKTLRMLFAHAKALDEAGIDHGELSRAPKNILVEARGRPRIIDFESASAARRTSNLTSVAQYLLIGGAPSKKVRKALGIRRIMPLIHALREYKREPTDRALTRVFNAAKLA